MATIETRRNKSGDITSYRIVVCAGYDSKGTKILRRKTWKPDPQKTQRQNDKALQKAAALFEQSVEQGYQLDNTTTFRAASMIPAITWRSIFLLPLGPKSLHPLTALW